MLVVLLGPFFLHPHYKPGIPAATQAKATNNPVV
jgi:hypothetical protein